ncbi:uncharacterized protein BP5553_01445 [Venustampulla echinocandica]|uniref:Ketosynthase family 3 (KS3) domain-containing protein n=1 Tax=Venustampulla echinocandica TaxID=2656787 RepID=A0A370U113_9HELO|nr:uncharacterized protein BP5553_01445 [Venustampulla echinocandica]RDL41466.1 hypothetical protein BP5553_01445 [Venustampulla echinocandica]
MGLYRITGHGDYVEHNRVSYEFDFKGPRQATSSAPDANILMDTQGVVSPTRTSKSIDANADGSARGEAINAIFIKKLSDAVICGSATNSDGKTPVISFPNTEAHKAVIRRAYQEAGIDDFSRTAMVECHGTGTPVGNRLEAGAVARVFGNDE